MKDEWNRKERNEKKNDRVKGKENTRQDKAQKRDRGHENEIKQF